MYKNGSTWKAAIAPLLLIVAILALEMYRIKTGVFYTSAPIFPLVVFVAIANGTLLGVAGALIASIYAIYVTPDLMRAMIVSVSYVFTAAMIGYLNNQVRQIDTVDTLIHKLRIIHSLLLTNLVNWPDMGDDEKWRMVEEINDRISNIMTIVRGWHELAKEKESLKED